MISLKNKKCLITGGTRGIGYELANILKEDGCNVLAVGRESGDLETEAGVLNIIQKTEDTLGKVDILINCAGIYTRKSIQQANKFDFDYTFNINVKAPWLLCKYFVPYMKKKRWGRIVNFGSIASYHGHTNQAIYNASKHAILGLSRSLFKELNDYNIRVFCVSPGGTQTDMGKKCVGKQDFKTFLDPKEVADYVVYNLKFNKQLISTEIRLNRIYITRLEKII